MPTPQTEKNYESFDKQSKWSGDLEYVTRFNGFIGSAAKEMAEAYQKTNSEPYSLLLALHAMEQAYLDAVVLVKNDAAVQLGYEIEQMETILVNDLGQAARSKDQGYPARFIQLRRLMTDLFWKVRLAGHEAGLDIKEAPRKGDVKAQLGNAISGVGL